MPSPEFDEPKPYDDIALSQVNGYPLNEAVENICLESVSELLGYMSNSESPVQTHSLDFSVFAGMDPTQLRIDEEVDIEVLLGNLDSLGEEPRILVLDLITEIDISQLSSSSRHRLIEKLLGDSVDEVEGEVIKKPAADLLDKIDYTLPEFIMAFYKAVGGKRTRLTKDGATEHRVRLDEDRVRRLMHIYKNKVMLFVATYAESMHIDHRQSEEDQAIAFFRNFYKIQDAEKIAKNKSVIEHLPGLKLQDWILVTEATDRLKPDDTSDTVDDRIREVLTKRGISIKELIEIKTLYPDAQTDEILIELCRRAIVQAKQEKQTTKDTDLVFPTQPSHSILRKIRRPEL